MAVIATQLKKGQCIEFNGEKGIVTRIEHRTPGKGNALVMATMRSFQSGKTKDIRFASSDKVEVLSAELQTLEFSYSDPSGCHFMDPATFEMITLNASLLQDHEGLLVENLACEVLCIEGAAVSVELPAAVELRVVEVAASSKNDLANPAKTVRLETGLEVQAPLFVKEGDILRISTETKKYLSRA